MSEKESKKGNEKADYPLEKQGLYAKLWAHQSGGFLSEHVDWEHN